MFAVFVFLAVVGVGGFTFFRSFSLSGNVLADIVSRDSGEEILKNNDFRKSTNFDIYTWSRLSNGGNIPEIQNQKLAFGISGSSLNPYQIISQPAPLLSGKKYQITAKYGVKSSESVTAEIGFLENAIVSKPVFTAPLTINKAQDLNVFTSTFTPTQNYKNSSFYLKVTGGPGNIDISSLSVVEKISDGSVSKAVSTTPTSVVPRTSATATIARPSGTATSTATSVAIQSVAPAVSQTASPKNESGSISLEPKRTSYGFSYPISTAYLTAKKITVYRRLGDRWQVAVPGKSDSNFFTNPQDGLILENPTEENISLTVSPSGNQSTALPNSGWNLLYNQSPTNAFSILTANGRITTSEALSKQLISETYYLVKRTDRGLALQKKNFSRDEVPEGVIYVYFF